MLVQIKEFPFSLFIAFEKNFEEIYLILNFLNLKSPNTFIISHVPLGPWNLLNQKFTFVVLNLLFTFKPSPIMKV